MTNPKNKKPVNDFLRYSGLGFQMLAIILLGVFGGYKLDQLVKIKVPVFTVVLSLLSVALAIYYAVKDFLKK